MAVQHRSQLSLRRSLAIRTLIVAAAIAIMTWRNLDALKVVRLDDARMLNDALTNGIETGIISLTINLNRGVSAGVGAFLS